jgi:hypothetical protein
MLLTKKIIGTIAYMGGVPAVLEPFCWAWGQLVQYNSEYMCNPGEVVHYDKSTVSFHAFARDSVADRVLGDWLLMLDTDHAPEPDLAARMFRKMTEYDCDVLTALYMHKIQPYSPVIYQYNGKGFEPIAAWHSKAKAFQVDSAGAGALMIRKRVFERIRQGLPGESPFGITAPFGEDHSFFLRLHKLGIKTFAVPGIESPHLEIRKVRLTDHKPPKLSATRRKVVEAFDG